MENITDCETDFNKDKEELICWSTSLNDTCADDSFAVPPVNIICNSDSHSAKIASSVNNTDKCDEMGVENSWNEEENFCVPAAADFPIPLPPPPVGFDDLSSTGCSVEGVESGSLEVLFSSGEDQHQTDHDMGNDSGVRDVHDVNCEAGVCGLRNLGNTCFMSTGVQCLVATPSLVNCLLDKTMLDVDSTSSESLAAQLAALTYKMWSGNFSSVQPADFKYSLGAHYPQFKDFRQHDCQEFLALLLDGLHEQMNCANGKLSLVKNDISDEVVNDNSDINSSCDINIKKLDCGKDLQCGECWTKKESIDFNNYSYNNNNNNNVLCKKDLIDGKENGLVTTNLPSFAFSLQSASTRPVLNKNNSDVESNDCETGFSNNNNSKIDGVFNNNSSSSNCRNNSNGGSGIVKINDKSPCSKEIYDTDLTEGSGNGSHHLKWFNSACLTDILKDAKTSNVNVLVTEQEANNEIRFDSDKYPRSENLLRRRETLNFNAFHIYDNNTNNIINNSSGKRVKSTVTHYNCVTDFREGLDLKRIKMHSIDNEDFEKEKNQLMEYQNIKSKTLDINLVEKNLRIECERKQREFDSNGLPVDGMSVVTDEATSASGGCGIRGFQRVGKKHVSSTITSADGIEDDEIENEDDDDEDNSEGETHWEKHLAMNQSIIVDTFQGQFKSTVVCSACKYVSVTYEPFMYLSVPLPHAMERQICVTFIPADSGCNPVQYLITLNKRDKISKLREQLIQFLNKEDVKGLSIILAEVFDNHIAKILNDNHLIRYVDDINRSIYAFELWSVSTISVGTSTSDGEKMVEDSADEVGAASSAIAATCDNDFSNVYNDAKVWTAGLTDGCCTVDDDQHIIVGKACTICLEEKDSNMQRHYGCNCVLCEGCVVSSFQHYGGDTLICPVCRKKLNPDKDLVPVDNNTPPRPVVRMLLVPVVYRVDILGDGNNNQKTVKLFGHPNVVRLRNNISFQELYKIVSNIVPYSSVPYKILLVDGQGRHCSRCMFNEHCRGCPINNTEGPLNLTTGDNLAITFTESVEEPIVERHSSMIHLRSQQSLTLYDCIQAFSQSEVLDKQNPWYCPKCQQNQCATKTLSVWRCPDYLIVYLKRFVFHDGMSTKLEDKVMFPFHGLQLTTSISHTSFYDLYACVCHIGGVSAGHYTAYTQHLRTGEWYYYNDDLVVKQMPQEEDFSNAYILFYKKRGLSSVPGFDVAVTDSGEGCSSYNTV